MGKQTMKLLQSQYPDINDVMVVLDQVKNRVQVRRPFNLTIFVLMAQSNMKALDCLNYNFLNIIILGKIKGWCIKSIDLSFVDPFIMFVQSNPFCKSLCLYSYYYVRDC